MTWFAASVIVAVKLKKGKQKKFPVFENVYLIEAKSARQAQGRAKEIGKREQGADNSLTLDDEPAEMVFVGVRKIVTIANQFPLSQDASRPRHGTEVTYSLLELDRARDVLKLARGSPVSLLYKE